MDESGVPRETVHGNVFIRWIILELLIFRYLWLMLQNIVLKLSYWFMLHLFIKSKCFERFLSEIISTILLVLNFFHIFFSLEHCLRNNVTDDNFRKIKVYFIWRSHFAFNTLRPRHKGRHFTDDVFKCIFFNENVWIALKISLKFVSKGPINNIPSSVQIMAWRRPGRKPLSELMLVSLVTHICVTRPQWASMIMLYRDGTQTIWGTTCWNRWPNVEDIAFFKHTGYHTIDNNTTTTVKRCVNE